MTTFSDLNSWQAIGILRMFLTSDEGETLLGSLFYSFAHNMFPFRLHKLMLFLQYNKEYDGLSLCQKARLKLIDIPIVLSTYALCLKSTDQ